MTPPDSGHRCVRCDAAEKRRIAEAMLRKLDSGEREVREDTRRWSYSCFARVHRKCAGGSCACECHVGVFVPQDLAQRILAALEEAAELDRDSGHYQRADKNRALASELRAAVERKP